MILVVTNIVTFETGNMSHVENCPLENDINLGRFTKKGATCVKDLKKWPKYVLISSMYKNLGVQKIA